MRDQFSNAQQIRKPATVSTGGIVAAQSRKAAEVGAEVLAAGGDCVDAVVATTFALGVLEPWMSGLGGGGAMVLYRARENRFEVIDYGMRAPDSPGQGRSQRTWSRLGRGARRGRRHGRSASPPRQNALAGIAAAQRQAGQ
jgi:gamma-glutamyltranspeptidase